MCEQYSDKQIVKMPIPKMNKCSGGGFVFMVNQFYLSAKQQNCVKRKCPNWHD